MGDRQPVYVMKEGTDRTQGRSAQKNNIYAARLIAETVKTTLGPRGMDKMLVDSMGDVIITNDGATILKEIDVAHPAAKMVIEVAKTQDAECGDGTTTSVVLTGELLKVAEGLIDQGIHPTSITSGYNIAANQAVNVLRGMAREISLLDRDMLVKIANTSLASKSAHTNSDLLTGLVVDAVLAVRDGDHDIDMNNILVQKARGGSLSDTELIRGVVLDQERVHSAMPMDVENAHIALVSSALEIRKTDTEAHLEVTTPDQLTAFIQREEDSLREMVQKVVDSGANVLICQKGIDDLAQHFLAKNGVYAIRRAKKSDMEKLARATGASIVNTLDDLTSETLGGAGRVQERRIGDEVFTFVTDCIEAKAVSILVRGGTDHVLDEADRALEDALSVVAVTVEDGLITPGGGAAASEIALRLREFAPTVGGREQMAVEAFADAVEVVPRTLAENAGLDEIDVLLSLRHHHANGDKNHGINVYTGQTEDMFDNNVIEPLRVGTQELLASTEAAIMILRIDDVIAAKTFNSAAPPDGDMDF